MFGSFCFFLINDSNNYFIIKIVTDQGWAGPTTVTQENEVGCFMLCVSRFCVCLSQVKPNV